MEFKPFYYPPSYYKTLKKAHGGILWWVANWFFNLFFERHDLEIQQPEELEVARKDGYTHYFSEEKPQRPALKLSPLFLTTMVVVGALTLLLIVSTLRKKR
jgi:hypothetical protein